MKLNKLKLAILIAAAMVAGGSIGYVLAQKPDAAMQTASSPMVGDKSPLYWYDPMVPTQHFDKPGKSPFMDMQLVPKYADQAGDDDVVKIDPAIVQNLGIRTASVVRGDLADTIDVAATVMLNNRQLAVVQARTSGFVERVYAHAPGDVVLRGAPLADVLVPDWASAQNELIAVLKSGDIGLIQAVRERLGLLGMSPDSIARVEKTGRAQTTATITAPTGGLIQTLDLRTGMTLVPGATLAQINGLDTVWVEAAVPEAQAGKIAVGRNAAISLTAYPGETITGKIIAVLPESDAASRTVRARIELPNRDGRLRPGMFAQVRISNGTRKSALLVPDDAVIRTGTHDVVLLALDGGRFQPVEVKLGEAGNGKVAVLDGLAEGQRIVVSGQFLIDSEASLRGVMARLNNTEASGANPEMAGTVHEGVGKVEAVGAESVTISHDPIQSLGWGAMTMPFDLANPQMAKSIKVGDRVHFFIHQSETGYVIDKLQTEAAQ